MLLNMFMGLNIFKNNFLLNKMPDINGYTILKEIGKGTYGIVYLVKDKLEKKYAMKKINVSKVSLKEKEFILSEILIQKFNKSPYIINLKDTFYENNNIYIVSEYAEKGDLGNFIAKTKKTKTTIKDEYICKWILQIAWALDYLHKNGIIHRDIKSKNIFLTKDLNIKVGDFGIAKILENKNLTKTYVGTPYYMSPEVINNRSYNQKADVWSLGCILYELITLNVPFNGKDMKALENNINRQQININYNNEHKKEFNVLLNKMLYKNYTNRCNIEYITKNYFLITISNRILRNSPKSNFNKNLVILKSNQLHRRTSWNFILEKIKNFHNNVKKENKYSFNSKKMCSKYSYYRENNKNEKKILPKIENKISQNKYLVYNNRYSNREKYKKNLEVNYNIDRVNKKVYSKKEKYQNKLKEKEKIYLPKVQNKKAYVHYISEYKRNYNSPYSFF